MVLIRGSKCIDRHCRTCRCESNWVEIGSDSGYAFASTDMEGVVNLAVAAVEVMIEFVDVGNRA